MKKRNETNYRDTKAMDGRFSPNLNAQISERISRYCKTTNQNKTRFVENCVARQLDICEREAYEAMSKDELIELLISR